MIFHRKVTRCDKKRNTISVIEKSPWAFRGYTDIHSDWHASRQSQPFQNSTVGLSNVFWILLWIPGLKLQVICVLPSISGWVMTCTNKTQNARHLGILHVNLSCDRTGGCPRMQFSYLLRFIWHFLLWLTKFLHLNVINYYRADTTSLSYFCLITRHPLIKTLNTPIFC